MRWVAVSRHDIPKTYCDFRNNIYSQLYILFLLFTLFVYTSIRTVYIRYLFGDFAIYVFMRMLALWDTDATAASTAVDYLIWMLSIGVVPGDIVESPWISVADLCGYSHLLAHFLRNFSIAYFGFARERESVWKSWMFLASFWGKLKKLCVDSGHVCLCQERKMWFLI